MKKTPLLYNLVMILQTYVEKLLKTLKTAEVCKNPEKSSLKSETYKGIVQTGIPNVRG